MEFGTGVQLNWCKDDFTATFCAPRCECNYISLLDNWTVSEGQLAQFITDTLAYCMLVCTVCNVCTYSTEAGPQPTRVSTTYSCVYYFKEQLFCQKKRKIQRKAAKHHIWKAGTRRSFALCLNNNEDNWNWKIIPHWLISSSVDRWITSTPLHCYIKNCTRFCKFLIFFRFFQVGGKWVIQLKELLTQRESNYHGI